MSAATSKRDFIRSRMSANTSPARFIEPDDTYLSDANFKADISRKMRVPNKISMGDYDGEIPNGWSNNYSNISSMQVPERILVAGQDQHIGTRAPSREIVLDNSMLPTEPENIRVHTPPRVITLDKYQFPMVDDKLDDNMQKDVIPVVKPRAKFNLSEKETRIARRESTPPIGAGGEGLSAAEEVLHLRRQMAKLNRRVMAIELEYLNRQQKEKIIYGLGIAYFILKTIFWLNRS
ncbi:Transport and Golgi organization 11 [Carabus blaptoides fortunei]